MAGYDTESKECELYVLDYLASMVKAPFAAHGYGGFFTTALMDREYRKGIINLATFFLNFEIDQTLTKMLYICFFFLLDMTKEEAYKLLQACVTEIHKRLIINLPNFQVQLIDESGIQSMDDITVKNLK